MDVRRTNRSRAVRAALLALCLLLPSLSSCHTMHYRFGMGASGINQETTQQYYLFFGLIPLNDVDIQRVVGDLTSYDVETGFSYRDGFWASVGDFMVSLVLLPLTVTRQAVTIKVRAVTGSTMLRFVKMEGAGNDYVYVDAIRDGFDLEQGSVVARFVADRHFGVGGDGLIVLAPSDVADIAMVMWNADGSQSMMCGNGVRCLAKLAHDHGHVTGGELTVETGAGVRPVTLLFREDEVVGARVEMGTVTAAADPVAVTVGNLDLEYYAADAGNSHAVIFVDADPLELPVHEIGVHVQQLPAFAQGGVNVEVVQVRPDGTLMQRTFERGSGETMACGSGATAVACVAIATGRVPGPEVVVQLLGGRLTITQSPAGAVMEGPARTAFHGEIQLPGGDG